jgi:hypothetical protein
MKVTRLQDKLLAELVFDLSSEHGWLPTGEEGLQPVDYDQHQWAGTSQQQAAAHHRYNASDQGEYANAQK